MLIQSPVNSRKMVDFWVSRSWKICLFPEPWAKADPTQAVPSPSRMRSHSTWAEQRSRVYWLSQTRQINVTAPASLQRIQSGAKGDRGRDRSGDNARTWVQSLSRRDCQRHGGREAARWEPSRCQAVYTVDLMLIWNTGLGLKSHHSDHSLAWEAETKEGQSWRPWSLCRKCGLEARQDWWGLSVPCRSLCWPGTKWRLQEQDSRCLWKC